MPLQVLIPKPNEGNYFSAVQAAEVDLLELPTFFGNRFLLDRGTLANALAFPSSGSFTKRALLLQPTQVAGQFYSELEWKSLMQELSRSQAYLLLDDSAAGLDFRKRPFSGYLKIARQELKNRLVLFGGFSTEFTAGGLKFGYVATDHAELVTALEGQTLAQPDAIAMAAARVYFPNWQKIISQHRDYLLYRREVLSEFLQQRNIPFHEAEGGYSTIVNLSGLYGRNINMGKGKLTEVNSKNLPELLFTHAGIKIHSDAWGRAPGYYRFVFAIDRIDEAIARLKKFFRHVR
jgi:aspartate/methionine/tyrosine aminotransferase